MENFEDIEFDDIIKDAEDKKKRKKGVHPKQKGDRTERNLCKLLKGRFKFEFTRTVGSGNRHGQVKFLPDHAKETYSGDLVCPENFKFVIESKGGYKNEIKDIHPAFFRGLKLIDDWMEQALEEFKESGRIPIIAWKKDYKPWLGFIPTKYFENEFAPTSSFYSIYKDWTIMMLEDILKAPDEFFFNVKKESR
jgi:Holliday junction resolvase